MAEPARGFSEGTPSNDEEQMLSGFPRENEEQRTHFDAMEQAWSATRVPSAAVEEEWRRVQCCVQGNSLIYMRPRKTYLRRRLVVVAVVLVLVSLLVTYFFSSHHSGPEAYYICIALPGDKAEVVLPGGSHIWLNAGSGLRYPASLGGDNRTAKFNGGAYFEVAKHTGFKSTVNTRGYDVIVHGTKFNISAYDDDATVMVTLLEGSVQVSLDNERVMMAPGERVILNQVSGELIRTKVSTKANARIHGNTEYESTTPASLVKVLSHRFNMNITVQSPSLRDERLAIPLSNGEGFDGIMRGLQRIIPI